METLRLKSSQWSKYAQYGAKFSDLYSATLRDAGMLCLAIYRRGDTEDGEEEDQEDEEEDSDGNSEKVLVSIFIMMIHLKISLLLTTSYSVVKDPMQKFNKSKLYCNSNSFTPSV